MMAGGVVATLRELATVGVAVLPLSLDLAIRSPSAEEGINFMFK
jgi:hypothetical protein